jgi:flagellin
MTSILTNTSAMTALKVLRQNETALGMTQERISTGLKVNSAKDDASTWAISQGIKSDVSAFKTMSEGLTMAASAIKVAAENAAKINDQITTIKQKIAAAKAPGSDKAAIQQNIDSALANIANITASASFNGTNLIDNNSILKVLASTSRDSTGAATANYIDVQGIDLNIVNGGSLAMLKDLKVTRDALVTGSAMPQSKIALNSDAAAGTVVMNYMTASGQAKTLTLNVAGGASAAATATSFVQTFKDALKADGLEVSNLDATGAATGTLTVVSTQNGARVVSSSATGGARSATQTNQAVLNFTNATLKEGDEFKFSVNVGGSVKTTVLRVQAGAAAPAALGTDADGNTVVGIGLDNLSDATEIADTIRLALTTNTQFAAAAAAGVFGTSDDNAGTLTLVSTDDADFITDITLPDADYEDLLSRVEQASKVAIAAAQAFGTAQSQTESQQSFLNNLIDSLETGVGALIDADITAETARLNALQTQQQLATQSLSIANQSTQSILSLFRS